LKAFLKTNRLLNVSAEGWRPSPDTGKEKFMSFSRRRFLRAGAFAALFTGIPAKSALFALGQGIRKGDRANPLTPLVAPFDPLAYYTQSTLMQYLNTVFTLRGSVTADVTLKAVSDSLPANASRQPGRECFVLLFDNSDVFLAQETYSVQHPALGTFKLFLVPAGADENGKQSVVAIINRLSASEGLISRPPVWKNSKKSGPIKPERKI
jgi:hypothetical protein